jgi:hypothetical protein
MLRVEDVETLHTQWDRLYRIHRDITQMTHAYYRVAQYKQILAEDTTHPGAFIGLSTSTENPAEAAGYAGVLLDMGMRQDFVLRIVGSLLNKNPALGPAFERWRKEPTPTIAAVMIVRDEEDVLDRCLDNILPFVDECVVVDTGSVDSTLGLLEARGVEVYHHAWEDDYAKARNQALQYVTSDWVLWIDADEVLDTGSWAIIHKVMRAPDAQAIMCRIVNDYGDDGPPGVVEFPRVWKHDPRCVVRWPFYEDISWAIYPLCQRYYRKVVDCPDVRILHDGYLPGKMDTKQKYQRNLRMMGNRVRGDPTDTYARVHFARMLSQRGLRDHAVTHFEAWRTQMTRTLLDPGDPIAVAGFVEYGECLAALGLHDQAEAEVKLGVVLLGEHPLFAKALDHIGQSFDRADVAPA